MNMKKMIAVAAMTVCTAGAVVPTAEILAENKFSFSISKSDVNDGSEPVKKTNASYKAASFTIKECDIDTSKDMIRFRVLENESNSIASEYKNYPGLDNETTLEYSGNSGTRYKVYRLRSHYISGINEVHGNGVWTP